jgi:hypothetical protein
MAKAGRTSSGILQTKRLKMNERETTRITQHPDWLVAGLVRSALFPKDSPDEPMFNTGITYGQLKSQVQDLLNRSGVNLTSREVGVASYWLTERIAQNISDTDTKDTLIEAMNSFVTQYIVDKAAGRASGTPTRGPIHTREWYDKYHTPPEEGMEKGSAAEDTGMVYIGIDGDNMGSLVEESLLTNEPEEAQRVSRSIHEAHKAIRMIVKDRGGKLIFDGGDNMLIYMPFEPETIERMRQIYVDKTQHTATVGVGKRPVEAHYALVVGKNTGKDRTVIYSDDVKTEYDTIHQEQEKLAPMMEKLKYRAEGGGWDMAIASVLRAAMDELDMQATDEYVYDIFMRLIERYDLNDMRALSLFFAAADRETLKQMIREVYARRLDWSIKLAGEDVNDFQAGEIFTTLAKAVESMQDMGHKFQSLLEALDNPMLRDIDAGMEQAWKRLSKAMAEFCSISDKGIRHSHYVDEVPQIAAEVASMAIPIDQALLTAIKAVGNAQDGGNNAIIIQPVTEIMGKWMEKINVLAMLLDMICVVSGARPMVSVAAMPNSQPQHFPGQTNVPNGHGQKSVPKMFDWLSIEDKNKDQVDWSKTDDQYVSTNVPKDSQMMGGGDPGNPIYVP